jgi:hypothetical protein
MKPSGCCPSTGPTAFAIRLGQGGQAGYRTFAGSKTSCWANTRPTSFCKGEVTSEAAATLYAYITNFLQSFARARGRRSQPRRARKASDRGHVQYPEKQRDRVGTCFLRQCHRLQKLLHDDASRSNPLDLTCRGCLQRLYDWARRATEQGLARAVWEGLRACRLPPDLPPLGQIRFGFT